MIIREYREEDIGPIAEIWNAVVRDGNAFPQDSELTHADAIPFFSSQSRTAVAEIDGKIAGLYILHPNNIGRCSHIANASYAVSPSFRGMGIGKKLVNDSLKEAGRLGFRILQYNAVVRSNDAARHLYEELGFHSLGIIKGGFRLDDGTYEDICPYWREV